MATTTQDIAGSALEAALAAPGAAAAAPEAATATAELPIPTHWKNVLCHSAAGHQVWKMKQRAEAPSRHPVHCSTVNTATSMWTVRRNRRPPLDQAHGSQGPSHGPMQQQHSRPAALRQLMNAPQPVCFVTSGSSGIR